MIAAATLAALWMAHAAAPHLHWRTIETPCCDVIFPASIELVGQRVASFADDVVNNAVALFDSPLKQRVEIVIHDVTDSPNAFANAVPYNRVEARGVTPEDDSELAYTDDYLRMLIQHEIIHVIHLDTIHGIPALVNIVLGKVWPPNIIQPRFMVEGLATYGETRFTGGGRLRSTLFLSQLRLAALAHDLWSLDDVSNVSRRIPSGAAAYLYGAAFVAWLTHRYGERIWPVIARDYGGGVIPYAFRRSVQLATGNDFDDDYAAFLVDVSDAARSQRDRVIARGGVTHARRLTRVGGVARAPVFASDVVLLSLDTPNAPAGIYRLDGARHSTPSLHAVVRTLQAADLAIVDDATVVLTQTELIDGWRSFSDLWRYRDGALTRITTGARVRHPALIPHSRTVLAEQRTAIMSAIVAVDVDTGAVTRLLHHDDATVDYTPSVAPDGSAFVVSRLSPGGAREIVEVSLPSLEQRALTSDGSVHVDPVYSVDGKRVLFSADAEGAFCIYALDRVTLQVRRIVDTLGTALHPTPTPDGRALLYVDETLEGQDTYAADFDWDVAAPVLLNTDVASRGQSFMPMLRPSVAATAHTATVATSTPYNPLWTLRPYSWFPILSTDTTGAPAIGAAFTGEDIAGLVSFGAQATWGLGISRPSVSTSVRLGNFYLPLSAELQWRTDRSDAVRKNDGAPEVQQEMLLRTAVSVAVPLWRRAHDSHNLSLGLARELHVVQTPFSSAPDTRAPVYPRDATLSWAEINYSYTSLDAGRDSVGIEGGTSLFVRARRASALLASAQERTEAFVDVRAFEPVPFLPRAAVAAYGSGGAFFGDPPARVALGGFQDVDVVRDVVSGTRSGVGVLRGYPQGALSGAAYAIGTLEAQAPLLDIERGLGALPLFVERLSLATFADAGLAFDAAPNLNQLKGSLGVEVRLSVVLGYYGNFLIRAGYARGVSRGGIEQPYVVMGIPY